LVADTGWKTYGVSAEIISMVAEEAFGSLKAPPRRVGQANCPSPSSPSLAKNFFPSVYDVVNETRAIFGLAPERRSADDTVWGDVPDDAFKGPF
jgi:pyruvate/2-oxoglutarate/acetoin dehydrogenase E1 component